MIVVEKLEQLLLHLLIFIIPFQVGKHFWPESSLVNGLRIDYLSPTLYLSDVVIGGIFILFFVRQINSFFKNSRKNTRLKKNTVLLLFFFFILCLGTLFASSQQAALYGLLKVLEFLFLGMYIASTKLISKTIVGFLFFAGIVFSAGLAFAQFTHQGSIGGMLYFLGERTFNGETPGIANVSLGGRLLLRPYATFPHPNVLAGYLLISFLLVCFFMRQAQEKTKNILVGISFFVATLGILVSMSRIVWVLWIIAIIFFLITNKTFKKYSPIAVGLFGLGTVLFIASPFAKRIVETNILDQSVLVRVDLLSAALSMLYDFPLLGTGLKNFLVLVPNYMEMHGAALVQPVHNIFLLILVECGIMAGLLAAYFLAKTIIRLVSLSQNILLLCVVCLIGIGFFDHYSLTLQQGLLVTSLCFGLAWRNNNSSDTMNE